MDVKVYEIDGRNFTDFAGFIQEFNLVFCSQFGATGQGNLDAFNDYLSLPHKRYLLQWRHAGLSRARLGHEELAKWLEERVGNCHPANVSHMQERLAAARRKEGASMFDVLVEIIRENAEYVELCLE